MIERPSVTEWFDDQPYPGPKEEIPLSPEDVARLVNTVWKNVSDVLRDSIKDSMLPLMEAYVAAEDAASKAAARTGEIEKSIPDIPVKSNVGPTPKRAYSRGGKKLR